ncbi:MAG: two pore domain potassium channel family protein [Gemmatimonadaceae bacterium]|nr:two pore domain potassium channel family protein [Gemmatimonadaceae bacterium]
MEVAIPRQRLLGQKLREYSIITWFFERVFWLLHQLSPSRLVRRSRVAHVSSMAFRDDPHGSTVRRSRRVEGYIIAWFVVELGLLGAAAIELGWPLWIPRTLAIVRILDIFQSSVNMSVFDQLRTEERLVISSAVRTLVLSFLNYVELFVCFGILYTTYADSLVGSAGWLDDLYFSAVTQLTIGYGDIRPVGWARFVSVVQGLISIAFTVLMLGRIVSVLPKIESVMKHSGEE